MYIKSFFYSDFKFLFKEGSDFEDHYQIIKTVGLAEFRMIAKKWSLKKPSYCPTSFFCCSPSNST
jgi:hypothetical protein